MTTRAEGGISKGFRLNPPIFLLSLFFSIRFSYKQTSPTLFEATQNFDLVQNFREKGFLFLPFMSQRGWSVPLWWRTAYSFRCRRLWSFVMKDVGIDLQLDEEIISSFQFSQTDHNNTEIGHASHPFGVQGQKTKRVAHASQGRGPFPPCTYIHSITT